MSDQPTNEITMFYATEVKAQCPTCGRWIEGWVGDPRLAEDDKCDFCGAHFHVHPDADVEFYS